MTDDRKVRLLELTIAQKRALHLLPGDGAGVARLPTDQGRHDGPAVAALSRRGLAEYSRGPDGLFGYRLTPAGLVLRAHAALPDATP